MTKMLYYVVVLHSYTFSIDTTFVTTGAAIFAWRQHTTVNHEK